MPAGLFAGAVRAKFLPHLGCGAGRGGVGSDFERFYNFLSFKTSNHYFFILNLRKVVTKKYSEHTEAPIIFYCLTSKYVDTHTCIQDPNLTSSYFHLLPSCPTTWPPSPLPSPARCRSGAPRTCETWPTGGGIPWRSRWRHSYLRARPRGRLQRG